MYSFIKPRKKYSLDSFTYMWLGFIVLISVLLVAVGLYIDRKNRLFDEDLKNYKTMVTEISTEKKNIKKEINKYLQAHRSMVETKKFNKSIENGIKNLFSLIPDQIKINKLYLKKYEVKIFGETDSPKTYKLLLEPPLQSIFDKSKVGFTKKGENNYIFSSYNYIKRLENEK